jgi:molybdopterin-guanine dinucleotide biosynthesis protein A
MRAERCVGALMAGGSARRFHGMPKGLALIGGVRIADRALAALRVATDERLVVANDARAAHWFPGVRIVQDEQIGLGPLAGLCAALRAADGAAIVVVAWDMPFVSSALLNALRAIGESGASAVAPLGPADTFLARREPLCAYYAGRTLQTCERLLERGERRAAALFDALPDAVSLEGAALAELGDPHHLLCSVDTAEELAALGGRLPDGEDTARR